RFMDRRLPATCGYKSRKTPLPRIMSGILNDHISGGPLCAFIQNVNANRQVENKPDISMQQRVGHGDYTGALRYRGFSNVKELGKFTDRFTAPLCFAGAVCAQILQRRSIFVGAHIAQIHNIKDNPFDPVRIDRDGILGIRSKDFPVINDRKGWLMLEDIGKARNAGESLGGIIECAAVNIPAGVGSPVFDGLENNIAQLIFGIPGVKGLEFGAGFDAAKMIGSQNTDDFFIDSHGHVVTKTNHHGGILGGISSGMPVTLKAAFNPVRAEHDSEQDTCIVPKAVPCVEAAVNIAVLSNMLDYPNFC
ncbi:MAG: chorismate synthase, partial [Ruminococcus sp.]|nr:chorismate synthase [Ruminococcus sp.]